MFNTLFSKVVVCLCTLLCCGSPLFALKFEDNKDKALNAFAKKLANKNGMELLNTGSGILVDSKKVRWCINLVDHRAMTIDQARPIVVGMYNDFLNEALTNPVYDICLKKSAEGSRWSNPNFTSDILGIRLAYWDQNVDRPLHPYLAQIKVLEDKIEYYYADPKTQALILPPITETIEEARTKGR